MSETVLKPSGAQPAFQRLYKALRVRHVYCSGIIALNWQPQCFPFRKSTIQGTLSTILRFCSMTTKVFSPIDDQEHSGRAAQAAIEIARATAAELIFFMVNPAVMPGRGPVVYRWTKDYIDEYFSLARNRARQSGVYDTRCIAKNAIDITRSILMEAEMVEADYIVVGSNSRPGPFGYWKYSITRDIAARAHCPTVIVHSDLRRYQMVSDLMAAE
jgi:nucleotide-binding universal stress UspA family protein